MLNSVPVCVIVGIVTGFLAAIGVGGGSILILWLTIVLQTPPEIARSINLLFFLPTAAIACICRIKQGTLQLRNSLPAILAGCFAALLFGSVAPLINTALLKKGFGVLLLFAGLRELLYRPRNAK